LKKRIRNKKNEKEKLEIKRIKRKIRNKKE